MTAYKKLGIGRHGERKRVAPSRVLTFIVVGTLVLLGVVSAADAIDSNQMGGPLGIFQHGGTLSGYFDLVAANLTDAQLTNASLTGYSCSGQSCNSSIFLDNDNSSSISSRINFNGTSPSGVFYYAPDGSLRSVTELGQIGQGNWSLNGSNLNFTLAGANGMDLGLRDSAVGGSYWIEQNGSLRGRVNVSNDFITVELTENGTRVFNSSNKVIFNSSFDDAFRLDNRNLISVYGYGVQNKTVYFFDWSSQKWRLWGAKNESTVFEDYLNGYASQSSADLSWSSTNTANARANFSSGEMSHNFKRDGTNNAIAYDLGYNVSNERWVLRFKWRLESIGATGMNVNMGLFNSSQSVGSNSNQDGIFAGAVMVSNNFDVGVVDDQTLSSGLGNPWSFSWTPGSTYYVEVKRLSTTSAQATLYSDPGFSNVLISGTKVVSPTVSNLRYIKFSNREEVSNNGDIYRSVIDDVQFWNGVSSPVEDQFAPDWLDPSNKQAFKWRYSFLSAQNQSNATMSDWLNMTYIMTAHDPFVRILVDAKKNPTQEETYSTNSSWGATVSGIQVSVDGDNDDRVDWNSGASGTQNRVYRDLGFNLSDERWTAEWDYYASVSANPDNGMIVFSSTNGNWRTATQDAISVWDGLPAGSYNTDIHYRDNGATTDVVSTLITGLTSGTTYYPRLERISPTQIKYSVFTDPTRTTHKSGSPTTGTIASTVVGLRFLQHGTASDGAAGTVEGHLDNLRIWNGVTADDLNANISMRISLPENRTSVMTEETDLVGYWNFNEGGGRNATDSSPYANSAGVLGAVSWISNSSCKFNGCLSFKRTAGDNDVNLGNPSQLQLTGDFTISAWVNVRDFSDNNWVIVKKTADSNAAYQMVASATPYLFIGNGGAGITASGGSMGANAWYHMVGLISGNSVELWLNGARVGTATYSGSRQNPSTPAVVGNWIGGTPMNGMIDDLRIYKRALYPHEIRQLFVTGMNQQKPGIYFTKNNATDNEEVLFMATNWKGGNHSRFNTTSNHTDWVSMNYVFNSTENNNLVFALGTMGRMNTTAFSPRSNMTALSSETAESVANSTLTWYDLVSRSVGVANLTAYYKFDEGSGSSVNMAGRIGGTSSIGSGADTVDVSAPTKTGQPKVGNWSWDFDGVDDCVKLGNSASQWNFLHNASARWTISTWVHRDSRGEDIFLTEEQSGASSITGLTMMWLDTSDNVQVQIWDGDASLVTNVVATTRNLLGAWHHVVFTYDQTLSSANLKTYVDGVLTDTDSKSADTNSNSDSTNPLHIGGHATCNGARFFDGRYDELAIWNRVLTPAEVETMYRSGYGMHLPNNTWRVSGNGTVGHEVDADFGQYDSGAYGVWRLDEGSGPIAADSTGNTFSGTLTNAPAWVSNQSCKYGGCLYFAGSNNYLKLTSGLWQFSGDFTWSMWIKPNTGGGSTQMLMGNYLGSGGNNWQWAYSPGINSMQVWLSSTVLVGGTGKIVANEWNHVAVRRLGTDFAFYINGRRDTSTTYSSTFGGDNNLWIGVDGDGVQEDYTGYMDEIRIHKRALSESEIWDMYAGGQSRFYDDFGTSASGKTYRHLGVEDSNTTLQPITPSGAVLHHRFNDNSTATAADVSGLGNLGTANGGVAWATNSSCKDGLGGCILLDGSNDYVSVPHNSQFNFGTGDFAISFWLRSNEAPTISPNKWVMGKITSGSAFWGFSQRYAGGKLSFEIWDGASGSLVTTSSSYNDNRWHHVLATRQDSVVRLYFDGALENSTTSTKSMNFNGPIEIGRMDTYGNVLGAMDEVLVLNRSLSPDEVRQLYSGGVQRRGGDLVGWWKLNDVRGPSLNEDFSGYSSQPAADSAWASSDTSKMRVSPTNRNVDVDWDNDGTSNQLSYDLYSLMGKNASNTAWVLRAKMRLNSIVTGTNSVVGYIGLSDKNESYSFLTGQDFVGLRISQGDTLKYWGMEQDGAGSPNYYQQVYTFTTGVDYFIEIKRNSSSGFSVEIFTSPDYASNSLGKVQYSTSGTIENLRYIKFVNENQNTAAEMSGTMDDVRFWDSTSAVDVSSNFSMDGSGSGNTGSLSGNATWTSPLYCKHGGCLRFDGTDDFLRVSNESATDRSLSNLRLGKDMTLSAWVKFPAAFTNHTEDVAQSILDKGNYRLYFDYQDGRLKFELDNATTTDWSISYNGVVDHVIALAEYNGKLYAALAGASDGDGDILVFDGTSWSTSYSGSQDMFSAFAVYNGKLYAGQGGGSGDSDVFVFDGSTWSTSYDGSSYRIGALAVYNGRLYAGIRGAAGEGDVLVFDGSSWSTSYNGGQDSIPALAVYNGKLYAGQGSATGAGDVLVFDGSSWSTSYDGSQEYIFGLGVYNGKLYAGQGNGAGDGDIFVFDGSSWSTSYNGAQTTIRAFQAYNGKMYAGQGDDGLILTFDGASWSTAHDSANQVNFALAEYNGNLYAGQGGVTGQSDIFVFGNNVLLNQSATTASGNRTSWTGGAWHHIAATYDGSIMKLYLNGTLDASRSASFPVETGPYPILIGNDFGNGFFNGSIDDVKVWKRALTADEVTNEYRQNQDRHSLYGNVHRVVSVEGVPGSAFNLTDKDGYYQQDYDQRLIVVAYASGAGDTTAPQITVASPANNSILSSDYVTAAATLNEAGSWCGASMDSGANSTMTNSSGNWNVLISSISNGQHNVRFYCNDTSGNMGYSNLTYFTVDYNLLRISGRSVYSKTGAPIQSGSVVAAFETGETASGTVTNGQWSVSLNSTALSSSQSTAAGIYINDTFGKSGYHTVIVGSGPRVTPSTACRQNKWRLFGTVVDPNFGSLSSSGTVSVDIWETAYTNSTSFSNGFWEVYIDACLVPGKTYDFNLLLESSGKRGTVTLKHVGK